MQINLQFFHISEQLKDVFRYNIVRNLFNLPAVGKEMVHAGTKQLASVREHNVNTYIRQTINRAERFSPDLCNRDTIAHSTVHNV